MRHCADLIRRATALATAGSSVALVAIWSLLATRGSIPEYIGASGVAALVAPIIILGAVTYGAVRLALRGRRILAPLPALLAILGHIGLAAAFTPALIDDVGTWRIQSIPLVTSVCAFLVAASLFVPRRRAAA